MKDKRYEPYIAAGITLFAVAAGAIVLHYLLTYYDTVFAFFSSVCSILRPIFMGIVLAFLLLPVQRRIIGFADAVFPGAWAQNQQWRKVLNFLSIILSLLLAAVLIYVLLAMLIPQLYLSIISFVEEVPEYIKDIQDWLHTIWEGNPEIQRSVLYYYNEIAVSLQQWLNSDILPNLESVSSTLNWLRTQVFPGLTGMVVGLSSIVAATASFLTDLLIAVIASVYILARKDIFAAQSKKIVYSILPTKWGDAVILEARSAYRILSGFINGKLLDSLIIGIICFVASTILNFPYPTLIATIIGVTNVIPFFGPFIGAIPCSVLIFLTSPIQCVYFVIFILILQQFDGNILGPKILGNSTGLASFWVLFSILLFGGLFGFAGMVLGVPVFAVFYSILQRLVYRGLSRRGLSTKTEDYIGKTGPQADRSNHEKIEENK